MTMDCFSLKDPFERKTGKKYEDMFSFEKVWKQTKTYKGEGYVGPYEMAPFAKHLLEEEKVTNPADALVLFYFFANSTTVKNLLPKRKEHYGPIELSPEDFWDSYSMRTLVKGKGACVQIGAVILALCKGVGIPACFKMWKRSHGYINVWVPNPGWVHIGYSEGILCDPKSELFGKYIRKTIELILKKHDKNWERKISETISNTSKNMVKFGICDQEVIETDMNRLLTTIGSDSQILIESELPGVAQQLFNV